MSSASAEACQDSPLSDPQQSHQAGAPSLLRVPASRDDDSRVEAREHAAVSHQQQAAQEALEFFRTTYHASGGVLSVAGFSDHPEKCDSMAKTSTSQVEGASHRATAHCCVCQEWRSSSDVWAKVALQGILWMRRPYVGEHGHVLFLWEAKLAPPKCAAEYCYRMQCFLVDGWTIRLKASAGTAGCVPRPKYLAHAQCSFAVSTAWMLEDRTAKWWSVDPHDALPVNFSRSQASVIMMEEAEAAALWCECTCARWIDVTAGDRCHDLLRLPPEVSGGDSGLPFQAERERHEGGPRKKLARRYSSIADVCEGGQVSSAVATGRQS